MYCTAGCIVGMCGCPLGMGMGWHARTHALHALISQRAVTQRGRGAERSDTGQETSHWGGEWARRSMTALGGSTLR